MKTYSDLLTDFDRLKEKYQYRQSLADYTAELLIQADSDQVSLVTAYNVIVGRMSSLQASQLKSMLKGFKIVPVIRYDRDLNKFVETGEYL